MGNLFVFQDHPFDSKILNHQEQFYEEDISDSDIKYKCCNHGKHEWFRCLVCSSHYYTPLNHFNQNK